MRIVLVGQAAFAEKVLVGLAAAGHEIAAVYAPPDAGGKPDPLAAAARQRGLPARTPASYKHPDVAREFVSLRAELGILAYVTKIIPREVIEAPRLGTICFHPSLLPRYRGGSALNWQIIRGETRGGFTVFWTDPGIDTGPILLKREVEIGPDDTAGSLYFEKIFEPGVAGMLESVELIASGRAPRAPQDEALAGYDPLCTDAHAAIDWHRPVAETYNLIRGCDPQPGAFTTWRGERLRLYDTRRVPVPPAEKPGTVLAVDERGMLVSVGEGSGAGVLVIGRMRGAGGKVKALELAASSELGAGAALGSD